MAVRSGFHVAKDEVLAEKADPTIERWTKDIGKAKVAKPGGGGGYRLPALGKAKAVKRGKSNLRKAASHHDYKRRVVVITYFYKMVGEGMPKLHSHLRYIERPEAQPGVSNETSKGDRLFDANGAVPNGHPIVQKWRDDRHHFRIIISPNDGHDLDMHKMVRAFMSEVEAATGTKLDWLAAVHEKPDATHAMNRHAHIIMRGLCDDGTDLVLKKDFILHEMRRIASDLATDQLGFMRQSEVDRLAERKAAREQSGEEFYHAGHRPKGKRKAKEQSHA